MSPPPRAPPPPPPRALFSASRSEGSRCAPDADRRAWASRRVNRRGDGRSPAAARSRISPEWRAPRRSCWVGDGRARGDHRRIVARHVGYRQGHDLRRRSRRREPSALDRRQMLAHAIDLADGGAAASSARVTARLSARVMPGAGSASNAEPPPETDTAPDRPRSSPAASRIRCAASIAGLVGHGVAGLDHLDAAAGTPWP